jgi:hypothetical protein
MPTYPAVCFQRLRDAGDVPAVKNVPVNYAIRFSGPVTSLTRPPRLVWASARAPICQIDPLAGYKAVVPRRFPSTLSSFSSPSSF